MYTITSVAKKRKRRKEQRYKVQSKSPRNGTLAQTMQH
jgi:hypothetical protein